MLDQKSIIWSKYVGSYMKQDGKGISVYILTKEKICVQNAVVDFPFENS
jgi:hypothetical protein